MRKATIAALSASILALAGCGGGDGGTPPADPTYALTVHYSGVRNGSDGQLKAVFNETMKGRTQYVSTESGVATLGTGFKPGDAYALSVTGPAGYTCRFGNGAATITGTFAAADVAVEARCVAPGVVSGTLVDSVSGQALADALVRVNGQTAKTGADGSFRIEDLPYNPYTLTAGKAGYGEQGRALVIAGGAESVRVNLTLVKGETQSFDAAAGATLQVTGSPARVVLPANALVGENGVVSGTVTATLAPIDPSGDTSVMPGDFSAWDSAGRPGWLESFGALSVVFTDAQGRELDLLPGKTAVIRIPLASGAIDPPATIPLFYYDEVSGKWKEEGSATLKTDGSGSYYEGQVAHFTTWNADRMIETGFLTGCVSNEADQPVAGASVVAGGLSYIGSSSAVTDAQGRFRLPVRARIGTEASRISVRAILPDARFTQALTVTATMATGQEQALEPCLKPQTDADIVVKLRWGATAGSMDTALVVKHATDPKQNFLLNPIVPEHVSAGSFIRLNADSASLPRLETLLFSGTPFPGTYRYTVLGTDGPSGGWPAGSSVELTLGGQTQTFAPVPSAIPDPVWLQAWVVFDLVVDGGGAVTVVPVNAWMPQIDILRWAGWAPLVDAEGSATLRR